MINLSKMVIVLIEGVQNYISVGHFKKIGTLLHTEKIQEMYCFNIFSRMGVFAVYDTTHQHLLLLVSFLAEISFFYV